MTRRRFSRRGYNEAVTRIRYPSIYLQTNFSRSVPQHSHILVPSGLSDSDQATLALGAEIASLRKARLTLLHVIPAEDQRPSFHWLDAIEQLHSSLEKRQPATAQHTSDWNADLSGQLRKFVDLHLPKHLRGSVDLYTTALSGQVPHTVARFANDSDVDLVIMRGRVTRWWQLTRPTTVQRVMHLTTKQVLFVRPGDTKKPSLSSKVRALLFNNPNFGGSV